MSPPAPSRPERFDLTALRHPAWWAALAVLVVNDRLFKGRGVVPAWLTGKLSDFALVIVAPTLFAAILPRALPWRRVAASASVLGLFVATELSRAVSDAFVAVTAQLGFHTKLWPDPTDLFALACLPLAIHLMRLPPRPSRRWSRGALGRAGVVLGAAACLADSASVRLVTPYLVNATFRVDVRFTWVLKEVPCDSPQVVASRLGPDDLDDPRSFSLANGAVAALNGIPAIGASPVGTCGTSRPNGSTECVGVILEADGVKPVLVVAHPSWGDASASRCAPVTPTAPLDPAAVTLQLVKGALQFTVVADNPNVHLGPIDPAAVAARPHNPMGCRAIADDVRALLASPTCSQASDCVGLPGPLVSGTPPCEIAINVGEKKALQELENNWALRCLPIGSGPSSCRPPHPATCVGGQCVSACPDVHIPSCPVRQECPFNAAEGAMCAAALWGDSWCLSGEGGCHCVEGVLRCAALPPPPPLSPTCPLSCLDLPGGFVSFPPTSVDAGGDDAREIDAQGDETDAGAANDAGDANNANDANDASAANDADAADSNPADAD
jgi:hypothetical protein